MDRKLSTARVATGSGRRYMAQLCSHFAHKLPATFDDESGQLEFPFGACALRASPDVLELTVDAADDEALARMEDVVARHLQRFAFRDPLQVAWVRG